MTLNNRTTPDRRDWFTALGVAAFALIVFTLALAPDVLYGDSGEFQTLAYTWSTTHSTGYPVYLLLARLVGIVPINTMAWRITFVSALSAAITVGGVYLVTRHFARRGAAVLSSLALMVAYTFWSQSIIAEVYVPAAALIVVVMLVLLWWSDHPLVRRLRFVAGLLIGLGLGVHLFLLLILPAATLFVLWGVVWGSSDERTNRWRHIASLLIGLLVGLVLFVLLFIYIDGRPTPTNFFTTVMIPSREAWDLQEADFDTPLKRFWLNVSGYQWRDAMLPAGLDYKEELETFWEEYLPREYTPPALLLAVVGVPVALFLHRRKAVLLGVALVTIFLAALGYTPGDKFVFFLPVYVLVAPFVGIGADRLSLLAERILSRIVPARVVSAVIIPILLVLCVSPFIASRWEAVRTGRSEFVEETYPYPVENLDEPRQFAECALTEITEPDAFLVMEWRTLWPTYYVAHVEQGRTGLEIREALPYGTRVITGTLLAQITEALESGRAVYADQNYPALTRTFTFDQMIDTCPNYRLWRVALRS
jgi:hypothetical protein